MDEHHNGNGASVSDGLEPLHDTLLRDGPGEVARCETETPLCTSLLGFLELLDSSLDVLRGGASNDGVILEARLVKGLALRRQNFKAFLVGEVDCLAGAA